MKKIISIMLGIALMLNTTLAHTITITKDNFSVISNGVTAGTLIKLLSDKTAGATYTVTSGNVTITPEERTPTMGTFNMPVGDVTITVNNETHVNKPLLGLGMTPVNYDKSTQTWVDTTESMWEWDYNSVANAKSDGTVVGNGAGKWANARTEDGSMWVWIPRYTYKITYESEDSRGGNSWNADDDLQGNNKIEIKFSNGTIDDNTDDYLSHPAFTFGDDEIDNKELEGFWIAKYEMSMETNGTNTGGKNILLKNNDGTNHEENTENAIMVSKPGVSSWRNISISKAFLNSYNYNRTLDSHLIRNSEWGAVAYLTNAIGRIPYINNSYITGSSGGTQNGGSGYKYGEEEGRYVKGSTTHNIYGVFDLSGGAWEFTSAYYKGGDVNKLENDLTDDEENEKKKYTYGGALYEAYKSDEMRKYVELYTNTYDSTKTGDAVYETSKQSGGSNSWDGDCSLTPSASFPVFRRGGYFGNGSSAGVFYFSDANGSSGDNVGFRACLSIK